MEIDIDASEIIGFGDAMAQVPGALDREMTSAGGALLAEGVSLAQGFAPVKEGTLRASIGITGRSGWGGSYGTSLVYAAMREYGGTIYGNPWLVFPGRDGGLVFVRSVTQTGTRYMGRSLDALRPRARAAFAAGLQRAMAGVA